MGRTCYRMVILWGTWVYFRFNERERGGGRFGLCDRSWLIRLGLILSSQVLQACPRPCCLALLCLSLTLMERIVCSRFVSLLKGPSLRT